MCILQRLLQTFAGFVKDKCQNAHHTQFLSFIIKDVIIRSIIKFENENKKNMIKNICL